MAKRTDIPAPEKAQFLLETVEDRLAVNPVLLDLRDKTLLFDFLLVCSGTSEVHIRAITDKVLEETDDRRLPTPNVEGKGIAEWVLLDYGDVVLHILSEEARERYKLETFWSTPQPKGALIPTPLTMGVATPDESGVGGNEEDEFEGDEEDLGGFEGDELDEEAFFEEADTELEPIEEDEDDEPKRPASR